MSDFRIGKFQVVGTLGSGAHSTILHVRRSADGTNYALKVVPISGPQDQKFLDQAEHEYRVAQMLDHPNLIKVYALVTWRLPPSTVSQEDGGIPIDAKTWQRMLKPVQEHSPDAPPALCDLIHRCLSFDAHRRPERMSEVQNALDRLVDELVTSPE